MRYLTLLTMIFFLAGCASNSSDSESTAGGADDQSTESLSPEVISMPDDAAANQPPQPAAQVNVPAGEDGKVYHFVCADGCEGGHGDSKTACPVCGKMLSHNQAYHAQNNAQQTQMPAAGNTDQPSIIQTNTPNVQQTQPFTPNPNQTNVPAGADGQVWHFVCAKGCEGGHGNAKGPCPVCGEEMAHNQAYHN